MPSFGGVEVEDWGRMGGGVNLPPTHPAAASSEMEGDTSEDGWRQRMKESAEKTSFHSGFHFIDRF